MKPDWIDIGPVSELVAGAPTLRKDDAGRRYACVLQGGQVHALDDRCPHQGYPLSQGSVRGGALTCEWHNWKFDLATGGCTFGGEPVRRYATRVEGGRVLLDRSIDTACEARRLVAGLRAALVRDEQGRALREALRLGELALGPPDPALGPLYFAFEMLAKDGAERAEYGFDHGLALLADLASWVERGWLPAEEAFVVAAHAVAEPSRHLGPRGKRAAEAGPAAALSRIAGDHDGDPAKVSPALFAERRDEAEARVRELVEVRGAAGARAALLPFVARHLYDYGHGAIFVTKAVELAERFPAAAEDVLAAVTVQLAWATAETSLPPFKATCDAVARIAAAPDAPAPPRATPPDGWDRAGYEAAVLEGERAAVEATLRALEGGADPVTLLRATGHAAAVRLARYDAAWDRRVDAEVGVLDVTHTVTFTEAAIALCAGAPPREAAQLAVIAAGFVGKIRKADAPAGAEAAAPPAAPPPSDALLDAVRARDVRRALAIADRLDAAGRRQAYVDIAPFAALDAAVRPILIAHAVKNAEALRRLEEADPQADGAYLRALLAYVVPARPEVRVRRTAFVARKFLRDGRPPEGLY